MTADSGVLDRIFDRLVRTLSASGADQLHAPFTVAEIVQSLVPYRTYRTELGVDTLQDYEHAVLEMLSGENGWLVCDPDTVTVIRKELASPDPDTGLLRRLQTVEVRMGAIRLPVSSESIAPVSRPADVPVPTTASATASTKVSKKAPATTVSDAVAIGAVMDREDLERAKDAVAEIPAPVIAEAAALPTPLHSARGVTVASAVTLARITPLSVPSVYGDPIEFRGVRHAPVDVGGVIFLFGMVARELGFNVEAMSSGFPRCEAKRQIAAGKWSRLRIDFELESRHFRDAGRNPGACDLIVCWRDTWPDRPAALDVLALERMLPTLSAQS